MATTSPDNIYYADTSTADSIATITATQATSVQAALTAKITNARQQQTYRWANTAARTAQTGMAEGDSGYQLDNDVMYFYDGTIWQPGSKRLAGQVLRANTVVNFPATTWTGATTSADWTSTGGRGPAVGLTAFNGTWVAPVAGFYRVEAQIALATTANLFLAVKKNDNTATSTGSILLNTAVGTSSLTVAQVSGTVKLAASDVLRLFVFPSVLSSWSATTGFSFFGIEFVEGV